MLPVNRSQKLGITALPKDANDRKTVLTTDNPPCATSPAPP